MLIASVLRSASRLVGVALVALLSPAIPAMMAATTAADGFDPNVNGNVYALAVQPDGKILIAGKFTTLQPNGSNVVVPSPNIARVLPDGSNDSSFTCPFPFTGDPKNGQINALVLQPGDGKIIIGGSFTMVGGATRNRVARLNADGSLDTAFDPNAGGGLTPEVMALALQADGKILVGGGFTTVQPNGAATSTARNGLARLNADGSVDTAFDPTVNGMVLALAVQADGKVLAGGGFTTVQPNGAAAVTTRNHLARFNADGTLDMAFDPNATGGSVSAIIVQLDGRVVIGGSFTNLTPNGGTTVSLTHLARLETTGLLDASFLPTPGGSVSTLKLQADGRILIGGSFSALASGGEAFAARVLADGQADFTFLPAPNFNVYAFAVQTDGSVVMGGGFISLQGTGLSPTVRNHVARVSQSGSLDADFRPDVNGRLETLAVDGSGRILVAGSFTSVAGVSHSGLVRLKADGTLDPDFRADTNGFVAVALPLTDGSNKIFVGGGFTTINGTVRAYVARLMENGTLDPTFDASPNGNVNAIALQDDKILIGGGFTTLAPLGTTEPITRVSLARLNANGSVDLTFTAQAYQGVSTILVQPADKKIVLAGAFTTILPTGATSQVSRYHLGRLNADGTLDTTFTPGIDGTVLTGALQSDGQILFAGAFGQVSGTGATAVDARKNILRLKADGTVDSTFDPAANDTIVSVKIQPDGKILVGGYFTSLQPSGGTVVNRNYVARLNTDGKVDESFDLGLDTLPGNAVIGLGLATGDKVIVGGAFTSLKSGAEHRHRLARVTSNGAVDTAFNADLSTALGADVKVLTQAADGSIFVAGSFGSLNGTSSTNIAHFSSDGAPDTSFFPTIDQPVLSVAQLPTKGEAVATQRSGLAWLENNGELRSGIPRSADPSAFSTPRALAVQADGKVLIAAVVTRPPVGTSTSVTTDYLMRLNPDGSVDTAFEPLINGSVLVVRVQPDQKILIGGSFTTVGTSSSAKRNNMARLNSDGSVDTSFDPNFGGGIVEIVVQPDKKILVGGTFTTLAPNGATTSTLRSNLARLNEDGTVDTTFYPDPNSTVRSIVLLPDGGGKMLVGGLFSSFQPNGSTGTVTTRKGLARLGADGSLDSLDFQPNGAITQLVVQADKKIIVSGSFTSIQGQSRIYLARFNNDANLTLDAFNPMPNDTVGSVALQADGKILIGGSFTALRPNYASNNAGPATPRRYAARLLENGTVDATFNPNFNGYLSSILSYGDNSVIAVGGFSSIQPTGSLLVGGAFANVSGVTVNNLALFSSDGSVSSNFLPNPNGTVYATQVLANGQTVIGGSFTKLSANVTRNHLARFSADNTLDASFDPNANGDVKALALQADGKILVGGSFTTLGGVGHSFLARVNTDGSVDHGFSPSVPGAVSAISVQADGRILVLSTGSGVATVVLRLTADGGADASFTPVNGGSAEIKALALQTDGKIIVGGAFTSIAGQSKSYLARLNSDGTVDDTLTSTPNGAVSAISISPDGKIVIGGLFNTVDGLPRFGLARLAPITPVATWFTASPDRSTLTWSRSGPGPEVSTVVFQGSADGITWDRLGIAQRVAGTPNWTLGGQSLPLNSVYFVRAFGIIPSSSQGSSGQMEARGQVLLSALPVITSATVVSGVNGADFTYAISATGSPTSYAATGLPAGLVINSTTGKISGKPTQTGTFTVTLTVKNNAGSTSTVLTLIVAASGGSPDSNSRLANISVLANVSNANPAIAGFVLSGSAGGSQSVLIRAVGPGLTKVGVGGVLASPHLKLYAARNGTNVLLREADAWGGDPDTASAAYRLGAQPSLDENSTDVAFLITVPTGAYSFIVSDNGTAGGYALTDIYDASNSATAGAPHLVNISARGIVNGTSLVVGGFVITGDTPKKVLVRGVGPGLTQQGVSSVVSDSKLGLVRNVGGTNTQIASNDNWGTPVTIDAAYPAATKDEIAATASRVGAFSFLNGSADAAILITLPPGVYSAQVGAVGTATGAAMVEVYDAE